MSVTNSQLMEKLKDMEIRIAAVERKVDRISFVAMIVRWLAGMGVAVWAVLHGKAP